MFTSEKEHRMAEIKRVKELVQKERETNIPIYDIDGCRGRSIKVYKDRCVITTDVTLGSLITSNATDGEKTIFYSDVVGVQYKRSGLTIGYIQLETSSAQMNNIQSNQFGENTFTFEVNSRMDEVRDYIVFQISRHKRTFLNSASFSDTVNKFSTYLFEYDMMTPDRRNRIKELHIYHDRNAWNLIIKVQCLRREKLKAIQADLEIKNVFDDVFSLKSVQFIFIPSSSEIQESTGWNCQIPAEFSHSISRVNIHVKKIAYEGGIVDEERVGIFSNDITNSLTDSDSHCKTVDKVLQEVRGLRRAYDMHKYLLTEIQQGTISIPDFDLKDLSETVTAERLYGQMPDSYLNKLEKILQELYYSDNMVET